MEIQRKIFLIIFTLLSSSSSENLFSVNSESDSECDSDGNLKPEWGTRSDLCSDEEEEYNHMAGCIFYWCEDLGLRFFQSISWTKIEKRFEKTRKAYALLIKNVPEENIDETHPAYLNQDQITKISRILKYNFKENITTKSLEDAFSKQERSYHYLKQMRRNDIFFDY
jgi:hypothetical protein